MLSIIGESALSRLMELISWFHRNNWRNGSAFNEMKWDGGSIFTARKDAIVHSILYTGWKVSCKKQTLLYLELIVRARVEYAVYLLVSLKISYTVLLICEWVDWVWSVSIHCQFPISKCAANLKRSWSVDVKCSCVLFGLTSGTNFKLKNQEMKLWALIGALVVTVSFCQPYL